MGTAVLSKKEEQALKLLRMEIKRWAPKHLQGFLLDLIDRKLYHEFATQLDIHQRTLEQYCRMQYARPASGSIVARFKIHHRRYTAQREILRVHALIGYWTIFKCRMGV